MEATWNGRSTKTIGDICQIMAELLKTRSKPDALNFMDYMRKLGPHADENVGYLTGYFSNEERAILQDLLEVAHPIFGRGSISADGALAKGYAMAKGKTR